jgi:hypothetical protein
VNLSKQLETNHNPHNKQSNLRNRAVIKLVPFERVGIDCKRSVMATTECCSALTNFSFFLPSLTSVMVADGVQVINGLFSLGDGPQHMLGQIETLQWKLNLRLNFFAPVFVAIRKALQLNNKNLGQLPQIKLLERTTMFFALRTIPRIFLTQLFLFKKKLRNNKACIEHSPSLQTTKCTGSTKFQSHLSTIVKNLIFFRKKKKKKTHTCPTVSSGKRSMFNDSGCAFAIKSSMLTKKELNPVLFQIPYVSSHLRSGNIQQDQQHTGVNQSNAHIVAEQFLQ